MKESGVSGLSISTRRLAYYLLYHIEDEEAIAFLFGEELKDRERNSFQEIGSTLEILTHLIRKYNGDGKYTGLLERAKNANFDCACGYDPDGQMEDDLPGEDILERLQPYHRESFRYHHQMIKTGITGT